MKYLKPKTEKFYSRKSWRTLLVQESNNLKQFFLLDQIVKKMRSMVMGLETIQILVEYLLNKIVDLPWNWGMNINFHIYFSMLIYLETRQKTSNPFHGKEWKFSSIVL